MGIEAFAEVARLPLPGWSVAAVEDVAFLAPFKFYRDEPRTAIFEARFEPEGDDIVARCVLVGVRKLAGREEVQETRHFEASVRLRRSKPALGTGSVPAAPRNGHAIASSDIYRVYFHGPAYQVLDRAWIEDGRVIGLSAGDLPDDHLPVDRQLTMRPRLIELCFQTAGVWELGTSGSHGLPARIDRLTVGEPGGAPQDGLMAVVTPRAGGDGFDAEVVDGEGRVQVRLEGYRTVPLPVGPPAELLKPFADVAATAP
jgi:Polyketide synthase dehydratase